MTQTSLTNLATAQCLMFQTKESDFKIPKHNIRDACINVVVENEKDVTCQITE